MAAKGIQLAITQTAVAVVIGGVVEALLPKRTEDASLTTQVFEALVQAGVTGFAIVSVSYLVQPSGVDPTHGIPFQMSLLSAQPGLAARLAALSAVVNAQVARVVQQMAPPSAKA